MIYDELDKFSLQVHEFLKYIRKKNISIKNKEKLYLIVIGIKDRTDIQKNRFLLYYGLMPNQDKKKLRLADISNMYNCTINAVRNSILRMTGAVVRMKNEEKQKLILEIIKNEKGE